MRLPSWLKSATGFTAAVGGPTRQDTYTLRLILHPFNGNDIDLGVWDKMSGGAVQGNGSQYRPGAMGPPVALGGPKSTTNVTVSRLYRLIRDHDHMQRLFDNVGKGRLTVQKQPMDINGNVYGKPIVYNGVIDRVQPPDVDSESTSAGLVEMEIIVDGDPSAF